MTYIYFDNLFTASDPAMVEGGCDRGEDRRRGWWTKNRGGLATGDDGDKTGGGVDVWRHFSHTYLYHYLLFKYNVKGNRSHCSRLPPSGAIGVLLISVSTINIITKRYRSSLDISHSLSINDKESVEESMRCECGIAPHSE
jgi:hypothetical protein